MKLHDIAIARSGDKGNLATLCVIAIDPADYLVLAATLSVERVRHHFDVVVLGEVQRWLLPHLAAVHFVMHQALAGGVTRSLALDAHGKTLASALLDIELGTDTGTDTHTDTRIYSDSALDIHGVVQPRPAAQDA